MSCDHGYLHRGWCDECYTDSLVRDDPERGPYSLRDRDGLRARVRTALSRLLRRQPFGSHAPQSFRNASPTRGRPRSRRIGASWQPAAHGGARRILLDAAVALFVAIMAITLWIVTDPLNLAVSLWLAIVLVLGFIVVGRSDLPVAAARRGESGTQDDG